MRNIYTILITLIFINFISQINTDTTSTKKEYIFTDFSNFKCDTNNYISSFTAKTCSVSIISPDQNFSFNIQDTNSKSHKVKCTINSNSQMRILQQTDIDEITDIPIPSEDFCYKTTCEFEEMLIENFTIEINTDFEIKVKGLPKNIYLTSYYYENLTFHVDKCFQVKNEFKQVSKYKINNKTNEISFLFISAVKSKVEKNEEIWVETSLQKNGYSENRNITCSSRYSASPVEKEEILMCYDCLIPNVKNINDYNEGLIFKYSPYVDNIPSDPDENNPKKTDELIKEGDVNDYSIITFDSKSLDFIDCEKTGIFKLRGQINGFLESEIECFIAFYLNNDLTQYSAADCVIPKGFHEEITISCKVMDNYYNSKISIPNLNLVDEETNETVLLINQISNKDDATCIVNQIVPTTLITPITTIITTNNKLESTNLIIETTNSIDSVIETEMEILTVIKNVVFRQINGLELNSGRNYIKFNIIGFTFENNIKNNMILPITVNLINTDENQEEVSLNCSLSEFVNSNTENIYSLSFTCIINDINDVSKYKDVIITSSSSLTNIPDSSSYLSSALNTDQLISENSLLQFSSEKKLKEIPPIISSTSISAENCRTSGVFQINGVIDKTINANLSFYIKLQNQDTNVRCKMYSVEANYKANIYCDTFENINYIKISPKIIYDMNYNELFYLNETESENNIRCANNDLIKLSKAQKKMESFVSFRQASKFRKTDNKYSFFLATFIKKEIDYSQKIYITVEIKSSSAQNIKSRIRGRVLYFRKLSTREEHSCECSVNSMTSINSDGIGAAGWNCTTGESSITDAVGLDILESDEISGIPSDPKLIDPAQTDYLIQSGEVTDYSIEENLNILLPLFRTLELNYSLCKKNGSLSIIGSPTSTIENDVLFNLTLSYPNAIFACKLPRVLKDQIAEIECYSREEFENYTVLIEESVIRYENLEYFILRNTSSGERYVTCSSTNSDVTATDYQEGFKVVSRQYKNGSSLGGLSVAGIIIIIIIGVLVLAGITILFIYIRSKRASANENDDTTENGNFKTTNTYY